MRWENPGFSPVERSTNWRDKITWLTSFLMAFKRRFTFVKGKGPRKMTACLFRLTIGSVPAFLEVHLYWIWVFFLEHAGTCMDMLCFLYALSFWCLVSYKTVVTISLYFSQLDLVGWATSTAWQVGPAMEFQKEFDYCKDLVLLGQWRVWCVKSRLLDFRCLHQSSVWGRSLNWSHSSDSEKSYGKPGRSQYSRGAALPRNSDHQDHFWIGDPYEPSRV